jgi:hypothetical protein
MTETGGSAPGSRHAGVTTARVVEVTGKDHEAWFALLDAAGATTMAHPAIAALLVEQHAVPGWWAQHLTVAYERARGLRAEHQRPDGFEISKSKTIPAPVEHVYRALVEDARRGQWLDGELEISSTRPDRTVNGRWDGGPERLTIRLDAKGESRTVLSLGHSKLPDAQAAEAAKVAWGARLESLKDLLT